MSNRATNAKQRLLQKLQQKKGLATIKEEEEEKMPEVPDGTVMMYDEKNHVITLELAPRVLFIMNKNPHITVNLDPILWVKYYRKEKIEAMVEAQVRHMEGMTDFQILTSLNRICVVITREYIDQHMLNLMEIDYCEDEEMQGCRIDSLNQHNVYILKQKVSNTHTIIEYIGLCWFKDYDVDFEVKDEGRDIIVHEQAYRCFLSMLIGIEFLETYIQHPKVEKYANIVGIGMRNLFVTIQEYGQLIYPNIVEKKKFPDYLESYAYWSQYKPCIANRSVTYKE